MLNFDQLEVAVAAAKKQFSLLKQKYHNLSPTEYPDPRANLFNCHALVKPCLPKKVPIAYLVLSSPTGQVGIDSKQKDILRKFPGMVVNSSAKTKAIALLTKIKKSEGQDKADSEVERLQTEFKQQVTQLEYDETCQVEIRFKDLNYELIWQLQVDDLVDRRLTPQGKASIRIVLGALGHFFRPTTK